jgi:hypothetical protein
MNELSVRPGMSRADRTFVVAVAHRHAADCLGTVATMLDDARGSGVRDDINGGEIVRFENHTASVVADRLLR